MEALQLKINGLQWEMNRLDAENRKLRLEHPEADTQINQMAELQQAREDVASLTEQLKVCEQRATDSEQRASSEAAVRADAVERRMQSLEQETLELQEANQSLTEKLGEAEQGGELEQGGKLALEEKLSASRDNLAAAEARIDELHEEKAAIEREATLARYQALEAEQRKWEARENRLVDQLEAAKRDHSSFDGSQLERSKELQLAAEKQLAVAQQRVTVLEQMRKDQKQRIDELTAELVLAQTKLRGLESAGRVGGAKVSTPPVPTSSVAGSLVGTTTDSANRECPHPCVRSVSCVCASSFINYAVVSTLCWHIVSDCGSRIDVNHCVYDSCGTSHIRGDCRVCTMPVHWDHSARM